MNETSRRLLVASESSALKGWMEAEGVTTREQAGKWLCTLRPPHTFQTMLDAVRMYELSQGANPDRVKTSRKTLTADLDRLYGLEWDIRRRMFMRIKSGVDSRRLGKADGAADEGQPGT